MIGILGYISPPHLSPRGIIKSTSPQRCISASLEGHVEPSGNTGNHGGPQHGARSIDVMDVTVHSQ
jgi:hypothetical protein